MHTAGLLAVKPLSDAKSRLAAAYPDHEVRSQLVVAMFIDTVAALTEAGVHPIVVVTRDSRVHDVALSVGAVPVTDTASSLNSAIALGTAQIRSMEPTPDRILVMQADLPCATGPSIREVLDLPLRRIVLSDRSGDGTALVAFPTDDDIETHFGPQSATAHRRDFVDVLAQEHIRADGSHWPELRTDVDTIDDLIAATHLVPGAHTQTFLNTYPFTQ